jgi:hypothetical protein
MITSSSDTEYHSGNVIAEVDLKQIKQELAETIRGRCNDDKYLLIDQAS